MNNKNNLSCIALLADIALLFIVVFISSFIHTKTIPFNTYYLLFFIAWILISLAFGKYKFANDSLKNEIISLLISAISVWGLLSLYVISLEKFNKNYNDIFFQILIILVIEIIGRLIYYLIKRKYYSHKKETYFSLDGLLFIQNFIQIS
jgi:Kef-type K+ transport system membrane component KefB